MLHKMMFLFYPVCLAIHLILNVIFISISYLFTYYFPHLNPQTYLFLYFFLHFFVHSCIFLTSMQIINTFCCLISPFITTNKFISMSYSFLLYSAKCRHVFFLLRVVSSTTGPGRRAHL